LEAAGRVPAASSFLLNQSVQNDGVQRITAVQLTELHELYTIMQNGVLLFIALKWGRRRDGARGMEIQ
jgi:hypothetical protein